MDNVLVREKSLQVNSTLGFSMANRENNTQNLLSFIALLIIFFLIILRYFNREHDNDEENLNFNDIDKYSMEIQWSNEDNAFIVRVPELPGCVTHGKTYEEAVKQGKDAIESWIEASRAWGDPVPPPRIAAVA